MLLMSEAICHFGTSHTDPPSRPVMGWAEFGREAWQRQALQKPAGGRGPAQWAGERLQIRKCWNLEPEVSMGGGGQGADSSLCGKDKGALLC